MLFDLGWSEILLIGTVALVFIGPKDLPKAMRVAGYWVRKARTLSREFQSSIDQMIREAELDEMRQDLKKAAEFDLDKEFHNTIDPTGSLREGLKPPELPDFSATVRSSGDAKSEATDAGPASVTSPPEAPEFHPAVEGDGAVHPAAPSSLAAGPAAEPRMTAAAETTTPTGPEAQGFTPPRP
jgi:sec-independent protein translocase protein TatB